MTEITNTQTEDNGGSELPDIETLFPRVDEKLGQQEWEAARSMLEEMETHYGPRPEIAKRLGLIHSHRGELEPCLGLLEKASELGGDGDELGQIAYAALAAQGDPDLFDTHFPRLRRIYSEEGFLTTLAALIERTMVLEQWEKVENWCRQGAEWFPDSPQLSLLSAELMLLTHRPRLALKFFNHVLELAPERSDLAIARDQVQQQIAQRPSAESEEPDARPIEGQVTFSPDKLYFSMPGPLPSFFYALPVLRQILRTRQQDAGTLIISSALAPLEKLLAAQPFIEDIIFDTQTVYTDHMGIQPFTVLPPGPNCFNLGFRPYLMLSQSIRYSDTLAILYKIPFIDQEEQHLLNVPEVEHRFAGERYAAVCPEPLDEGPFPEAFWEEVIARIQERFPVVLLGAEPSQPMAGWPSEKAENRIGRGDLLEAAGILKGAACFFGTPSVFYHIARHVGTRPFVFTDKPLPPQAILAPDEIFPSPQLPEALVHLFQMP